MSSDTAAASKQTTDESTAGSGVVYSEISDPNTKGAGDGADTKGEVLSDHPAGHPDGECGASREGDHDDAASEYGNYHPRGPPSKPAHGGPKPK